MLSPNVLKAALLTAETEIVRRTGNQLAIEGNKLPDLKPAYEKYKTSVKRKPVPDRNLTGTMLKAVHHKITSNSFERIEGLIHFQDSTHPRSPQSPTARKRRAAAGRAAKKAGTSLKALASSTTMISDVAKAMQKLKPFFGLSREQRKALLETIRKNLGK